MSTISVPADLTLKLLRLLADGEFHSGEALAGVLGVSRTTVWKALQAAEPWGVTLYKVHGRGYRLVTPIEWLDAGVIARRLGVKAGLFDLRSSWPRRPTPRSCTLRRRARRAAPCWLPSCRAPVASAAGAPGTARWAVRSPSRCCRRFARAPAGLAGLSLAVSVGVLRGINVLI